jgi:hypothetical protein
LGLLLLAAVILFLGTGPRHWIKKFAEGGWRIGSSESKSVVNLPSPISGTQGDLWSK